MELLSLITPLRTNFKYLLKSLSVASSIFIFRNLGKVGGASDNVETQDGYSDLGLGVGTAVVLLAAAVGSLEGG